MAAVATASAAYETWMRKRIAVVERDLALKHARMAEAPFFFLRATFYRWVTLWQEACPDLAKTPKLLAVGDLHVENFGTWRDAEGRLVWGVNDFDEAFAMPYAIDLVRLATSALLALRHERVRLSAEEASAAVLSGYSDTIGLAGGRPFVLEEEHPNLRALALGEERDAGRFWAKLNAARTAKAPHLVRKLLRKAMPEVEGRSRIAHRVAGLGSLGRPRYVALGACQWRHGGARGEGDPALGLCLGERHRGRALLLRHAGGGFDPLARSVLRRAQGLDPAPPRARIARRSSSAIFPSAARIS